MLNGLNFEIRYIICHLSETRGISLFFVRNLTMAHLYLGTLHLNDNCNMATI